VQPYTDIQKLKQERWEEAVNSIDFSHSSRKAWRIDRTKFGRMSQIST